MIALATCNTNQNKQIQILLFIFFKVLVLLTCKQSPLVTGKKFDPVITAGVEQI